MQPDSFKEKIADVLQYATGVYCHRVFRDWGLYYCNHFIGIIKGNKLYLRTNHLTRPGYIRLGMQPLDPADRMLRRFYEVPSEIIRKPRALIAWTLEAASVQYTIPKFPVGYK